MLDPMPRQDVKLPPTPREAELMAENERLRRALTFYAGGSDDTGLEWEPGNDGGQTARAALQEGS